LASFISSDVFWIRATLPAKDVHWLNAIERNSAPMHVSVSQPSVWGNGITREGLLLEIGSQLETTNRMVPVLVGVADPLSLAQPNSPKLLSGSYVRVDLPAKTLTSVAQIPRQYIHDGSNVRICTTENLLEIRPVSILYQDTRFAYVNDGIQPGEKLVATHLASATNGMPLRTSDN
jgi:hypothetical protein